MLVEVVVVVGLVKIVAGELQLLVVVVELGEIDDELLVLEGDESREFEELRIERELLVSLPVPGGANFSKYSMYSMAAFRVSTLLSFLFELEFLLDVVFRVLVAVVVVVVLVGLV